MTVRAGGGVAAVPPLNDVVPANRHSEPRGARRENPPYIVLQARERGKASLIEGGAERREAEGVIPPSLRDTPLKALRALRGASTPPRGSHLPVYRHNFAPSGLHRAFGSCAPRLRNTSASRYSLRVSGVRRCASGRAQRPMRGKIPACGSILTTQRTRHM